MKLLYLHVLFIFICEFFPSFILPKGGHYVHTYESQMYYIYN